MLENSVVLILLLLAFGLRVYQLDGKSLWLDEIDQALVAQEKHLLDVLHSVATTQTASAPLDYVLLHFVTLLGTQDFLLRFPAALYGTLSIAVMYRFGRLVLGKRGGIVSAWLLTISPFHIYYSQEARFYALFVLTSLLSLVFFYEAVKRKTWLAWGKFSFALVVSFYTHYFTALLILSLGLLLTINVIQEYLAGHHKESARKVFSPLLKFAIAVLVTGLFVSPLLREMLLAAQRHTFFESPALLNSLQFTLDSFSHGTVLGQMKVIDWVIGLYFLASCMGIYARIRHKNVQAALLLAFPVLGAILVDIRFRYFFHPRQVIFVLPVFLIFVAEGIMFISSSLAAIAVKTKVASKKIMGIALLLIVMIFGIASATVPPARYQEKEDWRDAAALISSNYEPGDAIITFFKYGMAYYLPQELVENVVIIRSSRDFEQAYQTYLEHPRTWAVFPPPWVENLPIGSEAAQVKNWLAEKNFWQVTVGTITVEYKRLGQNTSPDEIITLMRKVLSNRPNNLAFILALADAYADRGDLTEAIELYRRAQEINPDIWSWVHGILPAAAEIKCAEIRNAEWTTESYRSIRPGTMPRLYLQLATDRPRLLKLTYFDFPGSDLRILIDGREVYEVMGGISATWNTYEAKVPHSVGDKVAVTLIATGTGEVGVSKVWLEYVPAEIEFGDITNADWTTESYKDIAPGESYQGWLALEASTPRQLKLIYFDFPGKDLRVLIDGQVAGEIAGGNSATWKTYTVAIPLASGDEVVFTLENSGHEAFGVSKVWLEYTLE
jgi:mannosyltransferase